MSQNNACLKEIDLISKVSVEGFPSRLELYNFIDYFLEKHELKKDYTSDNKDNCIVFSFKKPVHFFNRRKLLLNLSNV
jgi:hypothetical protein